MASFFDQFSIGFKLRNDKQKKPKECKIERQHKLYRTKTFTKKGNLSAELARNLISLGYSLDSIILFARTTPCAPDVEIDDATFEGLQNLAEDGLTVSQSLYI